MCSVVKGVENVDVVRYTWNTTTFKGIILTAWVWNVYAGPMDQNGYHNKSMSYQKSPWIKATGIRSYYAIYSNKIHSEIWIKRDDVFKAGSRLWSRRCNSAVRWNQTSVVYDHLIIRAYGLYAGYLNIWTLLYGAFGWGGTLVKRQRRCPEVRLSMNRNHSWEEQAICRVDDAIFSPNP